MLFKFSDSLIAFNNVAEITPNFEVNQQLPYSIYVETFKGHLYKESFKTAQDRDFRMQHLFTILGATA